MKQFDRKWRPFVDARAFVRRLGLTSRNQWRLYCRSGERSSDIPSTPERIYHGEFQGWSDWLGKGTIAPSNREYRAFTEARAFVHELHLKNRQEWQTYCRVGEKPIDIPSSPGEVYKYEFRGWGDWLGNGHVAPRDRVYLPFTEARTFIHRLGLRNQAQWRIYCRSNEKPAYIPASPDHVYGAQFQGFGDWLGTGTIGPHNHKYRPFEEARAFVHQLGFSGRTQWRLYCQSGERPSDIPAAPERVYGEEFQGWGDWLGTRTVAPFNREYLSFADARAFVYTLHFKNRQEWRTYCLSGEKPKDIPADPRRVYKGKFKGMGDWLGTGYIANHQRDYRPFKEARAFVHSLHLKNGEEWRSYCQSGEKPEDIPSDPGQVYGEEFIGRGDWLGTGYVANRLRTYLVFEEACAFVQTLEINSTSGWKSYCRSGKKPDNIPANPALVYKNEFQGWGDWLGTGTVAPFNREYRSFAEARSFVHTLHLKSSTEWRTYCQSGEKPEDIPSTPREVYKDEFKGMKDWFGTGPVSMKFREYSSYVEARAFVHTL